MDAVEHGNTAEAQKLVDAAAKAAGYKNLFYHGAKKGGGFTTFRGWSYFTENKGYAQRYSEAGNANSLYTTYVKIERPFDTRIPEVRELFDEARMEYGMGQLQDTGLPDWTDGYDLSEYIEENDLPYDGIVLDEGGDFVNGKPVSRGLSHVIRNSAQIKSADAVTYDDQGDVIPLSERFDKGNEGIRYSLRDDSDEVRSIKRQIQTRMNELNKMDVVAHVNVTLPEKSNSAPLHKSRKHGCCEAGKQEHLQNAPDSGAHRCCVCI